MIYGLYMVYSENFGDYIQYDVEPTKLKIIAEVLNSRGYKYEVHELHKDNRAIKII